MVSTARFVHHSRTMRHGRVGLRARSVAVALTAAAAVTGLAAPAGAAPAVPKGAEFELLLSPAGELGSVCPFPVLLTGVDAQRAHENGGVVLLTGPAVVTATNLETGKSMTFNISGPRLVDPRTGNIVFVGQTLILQPTAFEPDDPFLLFVKGRVEQTSNNRIDNISGRTVDVCEALA